MISIQNKRALSSTKYKKARGYTVNEEINTVVEETNMENHLKHSRKSFSLTQKMVSLQTDFCIFYTFS